MNLSQDLNPSIPAFKSWLQIYPDMCLWDTLCGISKPNLLRQKVGIIMVPTCSVGHEDPGRSHRCAGPQRKRGDGPAEHVV